MRTALPVLLLLAASVLASGCNRFGDSRTRGMRYFEQKDYQRARIELRKAAKENPTVDTLYYYALACIEMSDLGPADRSLRMAMSLEGTTVGPHTVDIRDRLARMKYLAGDFEGAIRDASWVLKRDPKNILARETMAFALGALSRPDGAQDELQQLLSIDPANLQARTLMAAIKMTQGDQQEAENQLLESVKITKRSSSSLLTLANFYVGIKEPDKAEALLKEAMGASPEAYDVQEALGWLYVRTRRPELAEDVFKKISAKRPPEPRFRVLLATFYIFRSDWDKAIPELESLVRQDPKDIDSQVRLAGAYFWAARFQDAETQVAKTLQVDPGNPRARMVSALLKMQTGQTKEAIGEFSTLSHSLADSAPLRYYQGIASGRERNFEVAQQNMQQALKLDPGYLPARYWMADYFQKQGSRDSALGILREAPDNEKDLPAIRLRLGMVELANNRERQACEEAKFVAATDGPLIPQFYAQGFGALLDKCGDLVRPALEKALLKEPMSVQLLASLAHAISAATPANLQRAPALARVQKQIAAHPELAKSIPHLIVLANLQNGLAQRPAARETLKRAMEIDPNAFEPALALAQVEIADQKLDTAAQDLEDMVKRWPKRSTGWMWLGSVREAQSKLMEASRAYSQAVAVDPMDAGASNNLAWRLATDGGDLQRAVTLAKRATDLEPDNMNYADTLGFAYYKSRQLPSALRVLEELIQRDPQNADAFYHLGLSEKESGKTGDAIAHLETALKLNLRFPDSSNARTQIDQMHAQQGR